MDRHFAFLWYHAMRPWSDSPHDRVRLILLVLTLPTMNATNLASFDLAEHAIRFEKDASIAENGARWRDPHACTRQSILDTARMGKLSSDCWIRDYCERVWKLRPASVAG